jgi:type II secretion system protein L
VDTRVDHVYDLDKRFSAADGQVVYVDLWIPSDYITVQRIQAPTAPRRKWPSLIPWIMEERILDRVEDMHFVIGECVEDDFIEVFSVRKKDLLNWLRVAENSGVVVRKMVPDYFALPWEVGRLSVGWREGYCLVRYSASEGFSSKPNSAWKIIERFIESEDVSPRVSISVPAHISVPESLSKISEVNRSEVDWQTCDMRDGINLLEGEFKPIDKPFSRLWGVNITLTTILCALMFFYLQLDVKKISADLREIEQHIEVSYGRIFSGESIEVDELRSAFDMQLRRMLAQRKVTESMPLAGLRALSDVMSNCDCDLHSLDASSDTIRIRVDRSAELRRRALKLSEFNVDIETVDKSSDSLLLTLSPRRDR